MPHRTKFYDIALHGGGGHSLPADREVFFTMPAVKGEKA